MAIKEIRIVDDIGEYIFNFFIDILIVLQLYRRTALFLGNMCWSIHRIKCLDLGGGYRNVCNAVISTFLLFVSFHNKNLRKKICLSKATLMSHQEALYKYVYKETSTLIKILYCPVLSKVPLWTSSDPISDSDLSSKHWFCWKDLFRCPQIATKSEWWVKGGHNILWFSSIKLELEYHTLRNTKAAPCLSVYRVPGDHPSTLQPSWLLFSCSCLNPTLMTHLWPT